MLTYITHLVDCSWFENKSILTYITHRVFMLQMLQSMLTYLAHNKICGYRFLIVIYLSPNIYTVICVPKLLQIYNLKSHFKHTCWHTWCRISKWACVPKLEQKSLYSLNKLKILDFCQTMGKYSLINPFFRHSTEIWDLTPI